MGSDLPLPTTGRKIKHYILEQGATEKNRAVGLAKLTKKVKRLAAVKALAEAGKVRTTHFARAGAAALGLDYSGMMTVVMGLRPADF